MLGMTHLQRGQEGGGRLESQPSVCICRDQEEEEEE